MKHIKLLLALLGTAAAVSSARPAAAAAVDVVTSTPELAAIAREVGGRLTNVMSLARPEQDYHRVEAKPTDVVKVARADVFVHVGMGLDMWADATLGAARNSKVQPGGAGYVDASRMIRKKDIPTGRISGASGDKHPGGNPHYWVDPANGKVIAYQILLALRAVDPKTAAHTTPTILGSPSRSISGWSGTGGRWPPTKARAWWATMRNGYISLTDSACVTSVTWSFKPGVPPSGGHVNSLIQRMKIWWRRRPVARSRWCRILSVRAARARTSTIWTP